MSNKLEILTRVDVCVRNAEDVFVVAELPIFGYIHEFSFELFIGIREMAYQFFGCGGYEIVVRHIPPRNEGVAILNIGQTEV